MGREEGGDGGKEGVGNGGEREMEVDGKQTGLKTETEERKGGVVR